MNAWAPVATMLVLVIIDLISQRFQTIKLAKMHAEFHDRNQDFLRSYTEQANETRGMIRDVKAIQDKWSNL